MQMTDNMENGFDFNQVGKRMPYTVPDGFLDQLEADVMAEVKRKEMASEGQRQTLATPGTPGKALRIVLRTVFATAAAVALFLVVTKSQPKGATDANDSFTHVELAYNNLSADDQDFLAEIYEDDLFINSLTNTEDYE